MDGRIIGVLGMHRSGTSVMARALAALGVDLGEALLPVQTDNPRGFFEDEEVVAINDELLALCRSKWHLLAPLENSSFEGIAFAEPRRRAFEVLDKRLRTHPVWGFKDPRSALTLPFWRTMFREFGVGDAYVITVRNPLDCAASLHARDGMAHASGVLLWAKYMLATLRHSVGAPRVLVRYSRLMADPAGELARVARTLSLAAPDAAAVDDFARNFLDTALEHQQSGKAALRRSPDIPQFVADLYLQISDWADNNPPTDDKAEAILAPMAARLAEFAPALHQIDRLSELLGGAWGGLEEERRRREALAGQFAEADADRIETKRDLTDARLKLEATRAERAEARAGLELRQAKLDALARDLERETRRADNAERLFAQQKDEMQKLRGSLAEAKEEAALYRRSTSWKLTAPLRWLATIGRPERRNPERTAKATAAKWLWRRRFRARERGTSGARAPQAGAAEPHPGESLAPRAAPRGTFDDRLAIILHAYYIEPLADVLERIRRACPDARIYATTTAATEREARAALAASGLDAELAVLGNRGRDILPFLVSLRAVVAAGHPYLLKLHTKKSPHLENGARWRDELYESLLAPGAAESALAAFADDPEIGLIGPEGHLLSVGEFLGANGALLARLARRLGLDASDLDNAGFVAGSMFYARADMWDGLLAANFSPEEFAETPGETDGTLAHAIERLFGVIARERGLKLSSLAFPGEPPTLLRAGEYRFV